MNEKKPKKINRDNWVKGKLRQMSLRWPPRSEALKLSRKERGKYQCAMCMDLFKGHQVHLDHIESVIALNNDGFDWNNFIPRLFCDVEGFQVLCTTCHEIKTFKEDKMRAHFNEIKREAKKNIKGNK